MTTATCIMAFGESIGIWAVISTNFERALIKHKQVSLPHGSNKSLSWNVTLRTWASYQIRKTVGCACTGNAGNIFPRHRLQKKLLVSDPGMHHGTCVTHVPCCMPGSPTSDGGENDPGIPGACTPAILRIWQEAHTETAKAIDWTFI